MKNTKSNKVKGPVAGEVYGPDDIGRLAQIDGGVPLLKFEGLSPRALFRTRDGKTHPIGFAHVDMDGYPAVYFGHGPSGDDFVHRVGLDR